MARLRGISLLALAWAALACATPKSTPLTPEGRSTIAKAAVVHAVTRTPERLSLRTPGGALVGGGGALGGLGSLEVFAQQGEALRTRHGIGDPAFRLVERLGAALREQTGAPPVALVRDPVPSDDAAALAARFERGLVLEAHTESWELLYFPTDWSHYRLVYRASARLLEAPSGRVLWSDACETESGDAGPPPTLEALEAKGAALLETMLDQAADVCAERLALGFAPSI